MVLKFRSLLCIAVMAVAGAHSGLPVSRILEGENGNTYAYLDNISNYSIQYGSCVRVKIPNENDDDQVEGNVNFYNGRYHAQYMRYATFHLCSINGNSCDCDYSVEYATEMDQFLKSTMNHLDQYCGGCAEMCVNRRRLEQEDSVDCNSCSNDCALYNKGNTNADESQYIDCQAAYQDEDGVQYYYAPQCDEHGKIEIGVFYDEECTIKTKGSAPEFNYYKFQTATQLCFDCNDADLCDELYEESYHCLNGNEASGKKEDQMAVCGTIKKASTSHDYSNVKRKSGADKFLELFFLVLVMSLIGTFLFLTYTYYVRHRGGRPLTDPLTSQDHDVMGEGSPAEQATLT